MLKFIAATIFVTICGSTFGQTSPFGVCAHLHRGAEFNDHEQELQLMQDAGIRWARADFSWGYFEPEDDQWRFDNYDTIVSAAKAHDVTLLPILCYNVDWAFPAHDHLDEWCEYVDTVVRRYDDDLRYWEVWNEPNIGFWKPQPDPTQYAKLLQATYETIKAIDPDLQVVYGGTAGIPFDFLEETFELGACEAFDVLAVHPYRYPRIPERANIVEDLRKTWELLDEYDAADKPMWITEFGWPTHRSAVLGDGSFLAQLIRYAAELEFGDRERFNAAVLHEEGVPGCGELGPLVNEALNRMPDVSSALVGLEELEDSRPDETQILVMPTGEHYPADYYGSMLSFVRDGGLLAHLGGVPFYYASRKQDGEWEGPHAGDAGQGPLHIGWKAWWTHEGVPEEASNTKLVAPEESGIELPEKVSSTRWLTDSKLAEGDEFVPLLAGYDGDGDLVGYPVAVYLYDSDLKGAFLGTILDVSSRGVTEDTQALYLPRAIMLALGERVERITWYEFRDGGHDWTYNEHRFGTIHYDLSPKPAYYSYQALTTALGEARFVEKLDVGDGNYCYVFDTGGTKTAAIWRDEGTDTVALEVSGDDIAAYDYQWNEVAADVEAGRVQVTAGPEVTYLTGLEQAEAR